MQTSEILIGCAGWSLPKAQQPRFGVEGSHLERYAAKLDCVEINSSFYRPHRRSTYERWAGSVPDDFRFAVKVPREITHRQRLVAATETLDAFAAQVEGLGLKLGCLLVQLPPSLAYEADVAREFFVMFRDRWQGATALEPRHPSWFDDARAAALLMEFQIARVAADPAPPSAPAAAEPGGWRGFTYVRLHGSPRMYYSNYAAEALMDTAARLRTSVHEGRPAWCIFDNTAEGAALDNALDLRDLLSTGGDGVFLQPRPRGAYFSMETPLE